MSITLKRLLITATAIATLTTQVPFASATTPIKSLDPCEMSAVYGTEPCKPIKPLNPCEMAAVYGAEPCKPIKSLNPCEKAAVYGTTQCRQKDKK